MDLSIRKPADLPRRCRPRTYPRVRKPMPDIKVLQLSDLRMDATQVRKATSEEPIARYIERYKNKESMDPIDVCFDGTTYWLADGFHRVAAVTRMGGKSMRATVHDGGRVEAWRMGCEKNNRHGLPRSNEDKRYAVGVCLEDPEWREWSDRAIAEHCAVSDRMVNKMRAERAEASTANGSQLKPAPDAQNADSGQSEPSKRIGRDGKKRPAKQPKTPPKSEPVTEESGGTDAPPAEEHPAGWAEATEACAGVERLLREAISALESFEATPASVWLPRVSGKSQIRIALEKARNEMFTSRPSERCGKCESGCDHCRKSGWLPKYMTTKNAKSTRAE